MLEISGTGAATEERIVAIEKKVRDLEALVKGLTQELLDLKSIAMKMSKQTEERSRQEAKRGPAVVQGVQPQPARHTCRHSRSFKYGRHAQRPPSIRCPISTARTIHGHDHAIGWNHETGRTAR